MPDPILPINLRTPWNATSSESSGVIVARPGNATSVPPQPEPFVSLLVASQKEQLKIPKAPVPVKIIKKQFVDISLLSFLRKRKVLKRK